MNARTTLQPSLNGHEPAIVPDPAHAAPRRRRGRIWIVGIFALLSINFTVVGVTVFLALSDPSVAVEPDYYRKGLEWNQTARQLQHNRTLGWSTNVSFDRAADGSARTLRVKLTNKLAEPISGAHVECEYFANTDSGHRVKTPLAAVPNEPGVYAAPARLDRTGLWHVRVRAQTAVDTFTSECDTLVAND